MPCYSISPSTRRSIGHFNPFFNPYTISVAPRYTAPSFLRNFEEEFSQFDNFFREVDAQLSKAREQQQLQQQRAFQPRFDIKEENDRFILNGELPGVQPNNLSIEFLDKNTLLVKGKVVRQESHGTPPVESQAQVQSQAQAVNQPEAEIGAKAIEEPSTTAEEATMSGALENTTADTASVTSQDSKTNYHKASVEDEDAAENQPLLSQNNAVVPTPATEIQQQEQVPSPQPAQAATEQDDQKSRYWISERTIGEFSRSFRFPGKLDQDAVKATLKDGILTVSVPKLVEREGRRRVEIQA